MKTIFKNTFLTLCFTVYCLSVFSTVALPSFDTNSSAQPTDGVHLTELSKILFPQSISVEGQGLSVVPFHPDVNGEHDKAFVGIQFLSKLIIQIDVGLFKESKALILKFRSVDIIFPFHNFW